MVGTALAGETRAGHACVVRTLLPCALRPAPWQPSRGCPAVAKQGHLALAGPVMFPSPRGVGVLSFHPGGRAGAREPFPEALRGLGAHL